MPYVINSKGKLSVFRPVRIANIINNMYIQALGESSVIENRKHIMDYTQKVIGNLENKFGDGSEVHWHRDDINDQINNVLTKAPFEVHETFLEYLDQQAKEKRNFINTFEAKPNSFKRNDREEIINPSMPRKHFWVIKDGKMTFIKNKKEFLIEDWIKSIEQINNEAAEKVNNNINYTTHGAGKNWNEYINYNVIKEKVFKNQNAVSDDDALKFWLNVLQNCWKEDPVIYSLANTLVVRFEISKALGYSWLAGTKVEAFDDSIISTDWTDEDYIKAFKKHSENWIEKAAGNIDIIKISKNIRPERDYFVSWKGYEQLKKVMNPVNVLYDDKKSMSEAYEPPQWLWARIACTMANNQLNPTDMAIKYYNLLSNLYFIPSGAILREAGLDEPVFLEDSAGIVYDELESIFDSIKNSLLLTKWTGNVSIDWSNVRSKGASILGGLRQSNGIIPYWKTLNYSLEGQGREGQDRPITMILPIWHKDILDVIENIEEFEHLKIAIKVPDLFMERIRTSNDWVLFDPKVASSLQYEFVDNFERNYKNLESKLPDKKYYKKIKAEKLLFKIIESVKKNGSPSLVFSDSNYACLEDYHLCGIDGIGVIPYEEFSNDWVSWPTGVLNLPAMQQKEGGIDLNLMKESLQVAFSMLSNSIDLDEHSYQYQKSIGIGAVGLMDCIDFSDEQWQERAANIAEAWHSAMIAADNTDFKLYNFNPVKTVKHLNERRQSSNLMYFNPINSENVLNQKSGTSFRIKSVWAPFALLSDIANTSEGGIGNVSVTKDIFYQNKKYTIPSAFIQKKIQEDPSKSQQWSNCLKYEKQKDKWSDLSKNILKNNREIWNKKIDLAATIRPWLDQGISISLSRKEGRDLIYETIMQSWYRGLNCIIFE